MFIVIEIQTYTDGTVGTLVNSYANRNEAESNYHRILQAAAISNLPMHTAFVLTNDGFVVKSECYTHEIEPEPTPEPEESEVSE